MKAAIRALSHEHRLLVSGLAAAACRMAQRKVTLNARRGGL